MAGSLPDLGELDSLYDPHEGSIMSQQLSDVDMSVEEADDEDNQQPIPMDAEPEQADDNKAEDITPSRRRYSHHFDGLSQAPQPPNRAAQEYLNRKQKSSLRPVVKEKPQSWPYPYSDLAAGATRGVFPMKPPSSLQLIPKDLTPTSPSPLSAIPAPHITGTRLDAIDEEDEPVNKGVSNQGMDVIETPNPMSEEYEMNEEYEKMDEQYKTQEEYKITEKYEVNKEYKQGIQGDNCDIPHTGPDGSAPKLNADPFHGGLSENQIRDLIPNDGCSTEPVAKGVNLDTINQDTRIKFPTIHPERVFNTDNRNSVRRGKQPEQRHTDHIISVRAGKQPEREDINQFLSKPVQHVHPTKTTSSNPASDCSSLSQTLDSTRSLGAHRNEGLHIFLSRTADSTQPRLGRHYSSRKRWWLASEDDYSLRDRDIRKHSRSPQASQQRICSPPPQVRFIDPTNSDSQRPEASHPLRTSCTNYQFRSQTGRQLNLQDPKGIDINEYEHGNKAEGRKSRETEPVYHAEPSRPESRDLPLFRPESPDPQRIPHPPEIDTSSSQQSKIRLQRREDDQNVCQTAQPVQLSRPLATSRSSGRHSPVVGPSRASLSGADQPVQSLRPPTTTSRSSGRHSPVAGPSRLSLGVSVRQNDQAVQSSRPLSTSRSSGRHSPAAGTSRVSLGVPPLHQHVSQIDQFIPSSIPSATPRSSGRHSPSVGSSRAPPGNILHHHVSRDQLYQTLRPSATSQTSKPSATSHSSRNHLPIAGPSRQSPQPNQIPSSSVTLHSLGRHLPIEGPSRPSPAPRHEPENQASDSEGLDHSEADDSDEPDDSSDGEHDLSEQRKYQNRRAARKFKEKKHRHQNSRMEKYARTQPEQPSQYDALSTSIHDYIKLLLGIQRKGQGQNTNRSFSDPPTNAECQAWEQRKLDKRLHIDKCVDNAVSKYIETHPNAKPNLILAVEADTAEEAISHMEPIVFASQIPTVIPNLKYSIPDLRTCEGALALAGFSRCALDWRSSMKTTWNEAVAALILQEWEKCYHRGGADKYTINSRKVTPENLHLILERWFETKKRKYVTQVNDEKALLDEENSPPSEGDSRNQNQNRQKKAKEIQDKSCRKRAQKRVCEFRLKAMNKYFPKEKRFYNIISEVSVHSEDEFDSFNERYRVALPWRSKDFVAFLGELDSLYKLLQKSARDRTTADKVLDRGDHREMESPQKEASYPPKGFPKSLIDQRYWVGLAKAEKVGLQLSLKDYNIQHLLQKALDWQTPDT
ncbi:uncharacterized protein MELLADRAFT_85441 [Melampsora larici-populina 98AG31]|uniref:Uncharacterized protein n=1 Tax=Melampsora larici-populina (strain 98AG31 / pathotype 3-4-7) TaxID=747676 RepID=F4RIQ0_MELLP|nr:uncharacterized protein MELLADRAFT_85441 [Melampsora larici-populina 98AG31]EGG07793.1 hypothetical protein MELLADRAFT_85441 [Melampsora larici-populina 98AG31]